MKDIFNFYHYFILRILSLKNNVGTLGTQMGYLCFFLNNIVLQLGRVEEGQDWPYDPKLSGESLSLFCLGLKFA